VLPIERRIVADLTESPDPQLRRAVEGWVDGTLRDMADTLRLGVALESLAFSAWVAAARPADLHGLLRWLEASPVSVLRSYPRLFRSLVRFGELELGPDGAR
jgi:hypothetical protein